VTSPQATRKLVTDVEDSVREGAQAQDPPSRVAVAVAMAVVSNPFLGRSVEDLR
jgi:hypothetical protein